MKSKFSPKLNLIVYICLLLFLALFSTLEQAISAHVRQTFQTQYSFIIYLYEIITVALICFWEIRSGETGKTSALIQNIILLLLCVVMLVITHFSTLNYYLWTISIIFFNFIFRKNTQQ